MDEVGDLLRELRELSDPEPEPEPEPVPISADRGGLRYELRAYSADVERDDKGFISRIVSPEKTHTIIRDELHRVVRVDTETEEITEV